MFPFLLVVAGLLIAASSSSTRRTSSGGPVTGLSPAAAARRVAWSAAQSGELAAAPLLDQWLRAPGRTAVDAAAFARALQDLHRDALADRALDVWNALRAPAGPPDPDLALGPIEAAGHAAESSGGAEGARAFAARWLAVPGRTAIDAGRFTHELQRLGADAVAEYALDVWNAHPREGEGERA